MEQGPFSIHLGLLLRRSNKFSFLTQRPWLLDLLPDPRLQILEGLGHNHHPRVTTAGVPGTPPRQCCCLVCGPVPRAQRGEAVPLGVLCLVSDYTGSVSTLPH